MRTLLVFTFMMMVALPMATMRVLGQDTPTTQPIGDTQPPAPKTQPMTTTQPVATTEPTTSALPTTDSTQTSSSGTQGEDTTVTPPPSPTPVLPASARRSNLMVKAGDKEIEWRLSYSHISSNTVFVDGVAMLPVMVIGQIGVEHARKDILIASLGLRYGIWDNLQGEIKIPYRYENDRNDVPDSQTSQEKESIISGKGVGDVEGNLYFQLPRKTDRSMRMIASVGIKAATGRDIFAIDPTSEVAIGTGFWSSKFGLTGVTIADPAALFWSLGYTYNWERKNIRVVPKDSSGQALQPVYVNVKPGNTIDVGGGIAYALNPRLSVNSGITVSYNGSTMSNGISLANTAITSATLRLGMIWLKSTGQPIDLSVSIGLTTDSPDFTLEYRRTYKF